MEGLTKQNIINALRKEIWQLQGLPVQDWERDIWNGGLAALADSLPYGALPLAVVHEFISPTAACATATNGFIAALLLSLMKNNKPCLWVSTQRSLFPPGLTAFGIAPHDIIFIDVRKDKDALWVMEQALQCNALAAVVAELGELSFAQSQRLQLVVETSSVTGLLHRKRPRNLHNLACVSRWRIKPIASMVEHTLPGLGFPAWEVRLEKMRGGRPGLWHLGWQNSRFVALSQAQNQTQPDLQISEHYA